MITENKYLRLEVIWKDEDLFELMVTANNGRFSGTTEVYEQNERLLIFANKLKGFPKDENLLIHSAGEKNNYGFFEMRFYPVGFTGKVGVSITMEENVSTSYRPEEKDKLTMELLVEPNAIDNFQQQLVILANKEEGTAELLGI